MWMNSEIHEGLQEAIKTHIPNRKMEISKQKKTKQNQKKNRQKLVKQNNT